MAEPNRYHVGLFIVAKLATPDAPAPTYSIELHSLGSDSESVGVVLQDGYASPEQALEALVEGLTYAAPPPPDLAIYDDGLAKTTELATMQEEMAEALHNTIARLETLEQLAADLLQGGAAAAPARPKNRFLAGAPTSAHPTHAPAPAAHAPPPLRRQTRMTATLPEVDQDLPARVHGQPFGGPMRGRHSG